MTPAAREEQARLLERHPVLHLAALAALDGGTRSGSCFLLCSERAADLSKPEAMDLLFPLDASAYRRVEAEERARLPDHCPHADMVGCLARRSDGEIEYVLMAGLFLNGGLLVLKLAPERAPSDYTLIAEACDGGLWLEHAAPRAEALPA